MADLSDKNSAQTVKIVGSDSSGIETNYIDATVNGVKVDGSAVTQPISAASLPLPTGASTSDNQTTTNTLISNLITATTDKTQWTKITDGTNNAVLKAADTPVTISDASLVTADSPYKYQYIKAAATTVVKSGAGVLHTIAVSTTANGNYTIYDNTAGSGTIIGLITVNNGVAASTMIFDVAFTTGLTIVSSSANPAITVSYK